MITEQLKKQIIQIVSNCTLSSGWAKQAAVCLKCKRAGIDWKEYGSANLFFKELNDVLDFDKDEYGLPLLKLKTTFVDSNTNTNSAMAQQNTIFSLEDAKKASDRELYICLKKMWQCESLYFEGTFAPKKANETLGPDYIGTINKINYHGKQLVFPFGNKKFLSLPVPVGTNVKEGLCSFGAGLAAKSVREKKGNPFTLKLLPKSVRNIDNDVEKTKASVVHNKKNEFLSQLKKGDVIECRIAEVYDEYIIVRLTEYFCAEVTSFPKSVVGSLSSVLSINEIVYVVVTNIDISKLTLKLSLLPDYKKRREQKEENINSQKFIDEEVPNGRYFTATIESFSANLVVVSVNGYKGYIHKSDLSVNTVRRIDDVVFKGEIRKVAFKECKNGKLYFSLKELENDCYPKELYNASLIELLETMHVKTNHFIAQLSHHKVKKDIAALYIYADKDGGELLCNPYTGKNIVAVNKDDDESMFEDGLYYEIQLLEPTVENVTDAIKNPYLFSFKIVNPIPVENPYRRAVEKNYKKFRDPKSNLSLSGLLDEVGMNMYSSRKRMFFELLQNADDASALNGVQMKVAVLDNYLIITHNGFAFNRNDFEAITSASNSNKRQNSQKTGYKGIGFKSVFTNSKKVFIKTGGFFFVFDKYSPEFQDFKQFYFKANNLTTEESQEEFMDDNNLEFQNFKKEKSIPWHLLPLWCEHIPEELINTIFIPGAANVAIALNMDEVSTEDYRNIILEILQNPRFMLFLRNTRRIQYIDEYKNVISIGKVVKEGSVTLKNSFSEEDKTSDFLVDETTGAISITDEALLESEAPFRREKSEDGKRIYFVEDTEKGPKELDSIPDRIAASNKTVVSFAIPLNEDGKYIISSGKENSLYAYLPMNESRFRFPFYINADFVLSSDREGVKDENLWNQFLFKKIGEKLPFWVANIASSEQPNYLNVLSSLLDEEVESAKNLSARYNEGYIASLLSVKYVLDYKGELRCIDEIAVDKSGLSSIIGQDLFCKLVKTTRTLPHPNIDSNILSNELFAGFKKIDYIDSNTVIKEISLPQNKKYIRKWFETASPEKRQSAFDWMGKKYNDSSTTTRYYLLENMPIVKVNSHYLSLSEVKSNSNIILSNSIFSGISNALAILGFVCSEDVTNHAIVRFVTSQKAWENYNKNIFLQIESRTSKTKDLDVELKYSLFNHFSKKEIMSSIGLTDRDLSYWRLFKNSNNDICSLFNMIHVSEDTYKVLLAENIIAEDEYKDDILGKYIIAGKDYYKRLIYDNWYNLSNNVVKSEEQAILLYKLASTTYDFAVLEKSKVAPLSEFINKEERSLIWLLNGYKKQTECFCNATVSLNRNYGDVIAKITSLQIPTNEVLNAVGKEPFNIKSQKLSNVLLSCDIQLTCEEIKTLLAYCRDEKDTIFDRYYIVRESENYCLKILEKGAIVAYTTNSEVASLITKYCPQIHLLQYDFSVNSSINCLVTGDELKKYMVKFVEKFIMTKDSFDNKEDDLYKWLSAISSISEGASDCLLEIRNKLYFKEIENQEYLLTSFKLQQDITLEKKKYPLSNLKPSDNLIVRSINVLIDRLRKLDIKESVIKILFNLSETEGLDKIIFAELNKSTNVLQNGTQLAFILNFANKNNCSVLCKLKNNLSVANTIWYSTNHVFLQNIHLIPSEYKDVTDYLTVPYSSNKPTFSILDTINDYSHIKENLDGDEKKLLLEYVCNKWVKDNNIQLSDVNRKYVCNALCLDSAKNLLSTSYALEDERIPIDIKNWIESDTNIIDQKLRFIKDVLHISGEESEIVLFRKFISGVIDISEHSIVDIKHLTEKSLKWIVAKSISLDMDRYDYLQSSLIPGSFNDSIDIDLLKSKINISMPEYESTKIKYYSYVGEMPHVVTIPSCNNYKCFSYKKGNAVFDGKILIYNDNTDKELTNIVLEEVLNKYSEYSSDDFTELYQLVRKDHAEFETGIDDGLPEDSRAAFSEQAMDKAMKWLIAHNYDVSQAEGEYSLYKGVKNSKGIEIPIVVKSCRSKDRHFELSPYQWMHLMKANSVLMLYRGGDDLYITSRDELLEGKDRISLTFDIQNLDSDDRISSLANTLSGMCFKSVQFDFGKLKPSQYHTADKLEDYHFNDADFRNSSNVSEGLDEDIDF